MLPWSLIAVVAVLLPFLRPIPEPGPEADRAAGSYIARSGLLVVDRLVSLVVGRGQPGVVLFLGGRQAELLPSLSAGHGLADRLDMAPPGTGGRDRDGAGVAARVILQAQWVAIFVAAIVAPLVLRPWSPWLFGLGRWRSRWRCHRGRGQRSCLEARRRRLDPRALLSRICCRHRGGLRDHCAGRKLATQPPR